MVIMNSSRADRLHRWRAMKAKTLRKAPPRRSVIVLPFYISFIAVRATGKPFGSCRRFVPRHRKTRATSAAWDNLQFLSKRLAEAI